MKTKRSLSLCTVERRREMLRRLSSDALKSLDLSFTLPTPAKGKKRKRTNHKEKEKEKFLKLEGGNVVYILSFLSSLTEENKKYYELLRTRLMPFLMLPENLIRFRSLSKEFDHPPVPQPPSVAEQRALEQSFNKDWALRSLWDTEAKWGGEMNHWKVFTIYLLESSYLDRDLFTKVMNWSLKILSHRQSEMQMLTISRRKKRVRPDMVYFVTHLVFCATEWGREIRSLSWNETQKETVLSILNLWAQQLENQQPVPPIVNGEVELEIFIAQILLGKKLGEKEILKVSKISQASLKVPARNYPGAYLRYHSQILVLFFCSVFQLAPSIGVRTGDPKKFLNLEIQ